MSVRSSTPSPDFNPVPSTTGGLDAGAGQTHFPSLAAALVDALCARIGTSRFGMWFRGHSRFIVAENAVTVAVLNRQSRDWLEDRFGKDVREVAAKVLGSGAVVKWVVDASAVTAPEAGSRQPVVGSRQSTERGEKPEERAQKSEVGGQVIEVRDQKSEVRSQKSEGGSPKSVEEKRKTEPASKQKPSKSTSSPKKKNDKSGPEAPARKGSPAKSRSTQPAPVAEAQQPAPESEERSAPDLFGGIDSEDTDSEPAEQPKPSWEPTPRPREEPSEPDHTPHPRGQQLDLFGDPIPAAHGKHKRPKPEDTGSGQSAFPGRTTRRWKALADFVVGACNRLGHASAVSVVEEPGDAVNPLVLHGPVGTGKTHLLEGIYAGLKRRSDQRPCYVTAEEFTTRFVQSSQHGKMAAFRRQFRECSTLLLDDLHFLATRKATQAEFLYTFDALITDGHQVVVALDCHPRLADELMPELVDRLLGGAVWGLLPPDPETRLEILRKKATGILPPIPEPVLKLLAKNLRGNVRELEGAVNSVRHYAKVTGRPVDQAVVREALGDLLRHAVRVVTVADVDAAVCTTLRLSTGTLQSKSRAWSVTHPRMLAIYLCRKHTAATYGEISKHFGAKTHSTAVASEKKVRVWVEKNQNVSVGDRNWPAKELVDRIERELQR